MNALFLIPLGAFLLYFGFLFLGFLGKQKNLIVQGSSDSTND